MEEILWKLSTDTKQERYFPKYPDEPVYVKKLRRVKVYLEQVVHFCPLCHYFTLGGLCYSPSAREVLFH